MDSLKWLRICASDTDIDCVTQTQVAWLAVLVVAVVVIALVARRSRDLSTASLSLIPVAIAINLAVGSLVVVLHLPIYLDSIGTVMVGVLAGPWAGALTGLLADLIWAFLPIPGGAGPGIAFFAPVGGVIGLMAGVWSSYGIFRLSASDERSGTLLSIGAGLAAAAIAFLVIQEQAPLTFGTDPEITRSLQIGAGIVLLGIVAGLIASRTVFRLAAGDPRIAPYLAVATGLSAGVFSFGAIRLLFSPTGYFATIDGHDPKILNGADLSGLSIPDSQGLYLAIGIGLVVGILAWRWATVGERSRLFPVWIGGLTTGLLAASMSAPIAAGFFGGVTGSGVDALVVFFRSLGMNVLQASFAQGLASDPFDKTISYSVVFVVLGALPITVRTMFSRGEATVAD
jgi:hypothetical protein